MKPKKLLEELIHIIENAGITLRKDTLKSKGGYCILDNNQLIILNKMLPEESHCRILARCMGELNILNGAIFIPPAIREYIQNELDTQAQVVDVEIEIQ